MSGILGIYCRQQQPTAIMDLAAASRDVCDTRYECQRTCDVDGFAVLTSQDIRSERSETEALTIKDGFVLSWDGRIDNCDDIAASVGNSRPGTWNAGDLILAAYRRQGIDGFSALVGEFRLALWDPIRSCVVLATDHFGQRALYYSVRADIAAWSSRCRALAALADLPLALNEQYIVDYFVNHAPSAGPFANTHIVPPGSAVVVDRRQIRVIRYWSLDPNLDLHYSTDQRYEEHLRDLFAKAVACRLDSDRPTFCELSGGVDSSSIVCVAASELRRRHGSTRALRPVSYVFDEATTADERVHVQAVEEHVGVDVLKVSERECPLLVPIPGDFRPDLPSNALCYFSRSQRLHCDMEAVDARVVLNGIGGDQLFLSEPSVLYPLADLLTQRRFVGLVRTAKAICTRAHRPVHSVLWDLVAYRIRGQHSLDDLTPHPIAEWLAPAFVRRTGLRETLFGMKDDVGFRLPSKSSQYVAIRRTMRPYALERYIYCGHVDVRYPYLDRRLVEFALAIPIEQKIRLSDGSRSVVRRAFRGVLPDSVRLRVTKAGPVEAVYRAISRERKWLLGLASNLRLADFGIVEAQKFADTIQRASHGLIGNRSQIVNTIALELWLRSLEQVEPESDYPIRAAVDHHSGGRVM